MNINMLQTKATAFTALHEALDILVLPSFWDAVIAKLIADTGLSAIATTNTGIDLSH